MIKMLTESNFNSTVTDGVTMIDFYADWCAPCRVLAPILESASEKLGANSRICKVNVDKERNLAQKYNVRSIPTLVVFKNGVPVECRVGLEDEKTILEIFNRHANTGV